MEYLDWQLGLSTHRERCKYAFDNSLFCDVEFLVVDYDGNKVTVPANKYPLAVCSPVFEAMFYGKLAEIKSPIHIPDCTEEGLREILRFAHYDEAKLTGNNVMEVLYLAKKYMMPALEEFCQYYIQNEVGSEDVLNILPQVHQMGDENLEKHFWKVVDRNTEQVILSKSFLNISRELLFEIVKRDTLQVNELNLFKALDKWATKRIEEDMKLVCNGETKRAMLGEDIIRLVRFPIMTQKDVAEIVLPHHILIAVELVELFSFFSGANPTTTLFSKSKRTSSDLMISDIRFECSSDMRLWDYHGSDDCLNFTVNRPVNLVGVRLYGSKDCRYEVKLKINRKAHMNTNNYISEISSLFTTEEEKIDGLYYGFTVTLDNPVRLDPGVVYTIEAKVSGPRSWSGLNGKRVVAAGNIIITYRYSDNSSNGTSPEYGQFPSLVLQTL